MSLFKPLFVVVVVALVGLPVRQAGAQDRYTRIAKLSASDPGRYAYLGFSLVASGDMVVMGETCGLEDDDCSSTELAAYVYQKPASGWQDATEVAKLTPSDATPGDYFGYVPVAACGDTVIVGGKGKAYIFVKPASGWTDMTETAQLAVGNGDTDFFSVAVDGDTIVLGDPYATVSGVANAGAAFVFRKPTSGWKTTAQYVAELTSSSAQFYYWALHVAISNDTIVVSSLGTETNHVFVYQRPSGGWKTATETAVLSRSSADVSEYFFRSISVSDETVVVGVPAATSSDGRQEGVIDVFVKPSGGWVNSTQTAELEPPHHDTVISFGFSVAFDGKKIVAGTNGGRAFVYNKPAAGGWHSTARSDSTLAKWTTDDPGFSYTVAIAEDAVIVGDIDSKVGGYGAAGASFVFVPKP